MKKILHFFGLETRDEIVEFKQRRAAKPLLLMLTRIAELEDRVKQLEDEKL